MSAIDTRPGTFDEALANGRRLLELDPQAAIAQAEAILRRDAANAPAHRLLGAACRRLKRIAEAEAAEVAAIQISLADPTLKGAAQAVNEGRPAEAERVLVPWLAHQPDDALALLTLAEARGDMGRLAEAEPLARRAVTLAPAFLRAGIYLAKLVLLQGRAAEAIAITDSILARRPGNPIALRFKARMLAETGDHAGTVPIFERLLAEQEPSFNLWLSYGDALRFVGRAGDAERAYREALALDPGDGRGWWSLANLKASRFTPDDVAAIRTALAARPDDADNALHLHFALGAAFEDIGEHEAAFRHYAEANRLRLRLAPYDPRTTTREVERSEALFTRDFLRARRRAGAPGPAPIFIVGMPRSGSTLVEAVLARHARVEGAGELPMIPNMVQALSREAGHPGAWRELLATLPPARLRELGEAYLAQAREHRRTDKPWFVDKLPLNWSFLGLIRLILPDARIVDVRRAPLDCCWSNYKLLFAAGHPASNDLAHMGAYYRDYVRLMRHFDAAMPGAVRRVIYERVVDDLEGETRALLKWLKLQFDPACLAFHEGSRTIATASSEQVRRPLNREGLEAWRPYEPWLGPLEAALGPVLEDWRR